MNKERLLKILKQVLEFEFEELYNDDEVDDRIFYKNWTCRMFDITEEEFDEIFGK